MLKVTPTAAPHYSLAHQQHRYSHLLGSLEVEHSDRQGSGLRDLELRMAANPAVFEPYTWRIAELGPGAIQQLRDGQPEPSMEFLEALDSEQELQLRFELRHEGREVAAATAASLLLPKDHWAGARGMPELLASFVQPRSGLVDALVKRAAVLLRDAPGGIAVDGYQSGDRRAPWMMAQALWQAVAELRLDYVSPPPDFAQAGQRVRLPERIAATGAAACLDASALFAACLEAAGLHPVIALTAGHACAGCWLVEDSFPLLSNEDPMDMRKRVDGQDIVLFETTLALRQPVPSFAAACEAARPLLAERAEADFVLALDVKQARERGIRPLPDRSELAAAAPPAEAAAPPAMEEAPPMPPVRAEEKPPPATPAGRVDGWQRRLLDLTKRNRMLNFGGRASHLRLYCPDIHRLEDVLAQKRRFKFIAMEDSGFGQLEAGGAPLADAAFREYAAAQLAKQTLVAGGARDRMEATLLALYRKAKNDLEEGGSNTLFMSLGMLRWREVPESKKTYSAPLIMLPLQLHRSSARARISVSIHPDEEPVFNATLIEFLQQDHEIDLGRFREELPTDEHGVDVARVWASVRAAVKEAPGFELAESVVVSNFSFSKFLMWRDLKERLDLLKENVFVSHLIESEGGGGYPHAAAVIEPKEVDRRIVPGGLHVPLNADSSQLAAVEAATKEQDFILEGPPGTGKSETIANIVAANIARGRKVLFVAEKMEALKVVNRRLEAIGIGSRCLELHSSKANKKAVLEQLREAWDGYESPLASWDDEHRRLAADRDALNRYLTELHGSGELCDVSPWEAMTGSLGEGEGFDLQLPHDPAAVPAEAKSWLKDLQERAARLLDVWEEIRDWDPRAVALAGAGEWSNRWEADFRAAAAKLQDSNARLLELAASFGVPALANRPQALAAGLATPAPARALLAFGPEAQAHRAELAEIIERAGQRQKIHENLGADPDFDEVRDLPVDFWQHELRKTGAIVGFVKRRLIRRRLAKRGLRLAASDAELAALSESKAEANALESILTPFVDSGIWPGWQQVKLAELRVLLERCELLAAHADAIAGDDAEAFSRLAPNPARLQELEQAQEACGRDERSWREIGAVLPSDRAELADLLPAFASIHRLEYCLDWNRLRAASCGAYALEPIAAAIAAGRLRRDSCKEELARAFHRWLAPLLIDASPALRRFRVRDHERLRDEFAARDRKLADATGHQVAALAAQRVPPREGRLSDGLKLLSHELNKKQRHVPIRKLMAKLGAEVLDLTPCMMMSPISIAQFLPRDFNHFDLVVFDEASQITVWDAVGTIARGRNVIVVGDPKQMPPTNFFSRSATEDEDDEQDYESILDRALDAGLKKHRLTGHYRSRHESLIAFSNSKYYENSLATYPAAVTKESAVEFHRVDGLYSKGKEANNPKEAQRVAEEILRRLRDPELSKLSIGVVALNQSQQRTIENHLDDMRRGHPELERFFSDEGGGLPLFVKNLETVQGDERDVIILSLGYGPTEPGAASMSMNFGPLNRQGGERRLNVAITRAKHEVLVFASMDYRMIDLSRTQARAVADLRDYLEYAERGVGVLAGQTEARYGVDSFDSDFERDVAMWLRGRGWQVQSQVGVSRFRVDLGVVDPDRPGVYLAGVECDGATYHGSPAARDRDRIRQQVLESLGWRFVRIWSTDYFRDPQRVMEDVDARLRELRAAGPAAG